MSRIVVLIVAASLALSVCDPAGAAPVGGLASWYGHWHEGRRMANGCRFHARSLSAASRTLPIGAWVQVRNRRNGRSVIVPITDRGPYIRGRIIDVSEAAAEQLGMVAAGLTQVTIEPVNRRPRIAC